MTVDVADCENVEVNVIEDKQTLSFSCTANGQKYGMELEVFEPIVKEESAWNLKGRNVIITLAKKDKTQTEEWWPRITKEKTKNQLITIDWARWKDPDEEDESAGAAGAPGGMGDFDPAMMKNMMGGGAMGQGGMDFANMMQGMGGGGMPGMGGMGGMPGMPDMGAMGGMGADGDSDDEEGEESQVEPHTKDAAEAKPADNLDDLEGEAENNLKKD